MKKALDIQQQLQGHMEQLGVPMRSCGEDMLPIRRALTAGLFPHAARRQPDGTYRVRTWNLPALHPANGLVLPWALKLTRLVAVVAVVARR